MPVDVSAFKIYDIRGIYPDQINARFMYTLGKAFATRFSPRKVVIGGDSRLSSEELRNALSDGLCDSGVDVLDLGLCGSEMVYFATGTYGLDGGLMITASHNPMEYNGCKMVVEGARPVGAENGLNDIKTLIAEEGPFHHVDGKGSSRRGACEWKDISDEFLSHVCDMLTQELDSGLKVVVNSGNGAAGPLIGRLADKLPCTLIPMFSEPDGRFPNGVPNPLLPENRQDTADAVLANKADLGVAFDGDFDRCFFFDENGRFVEGYYIVGLMAAQMLEKYPGAKIVHDPRLTWNTIETVEKLGGQPVQSKTGHTFIKELMRKEAAAYGGEMSAHHYFRDFWYCDSGILPFLLMLELMSQSGKKLSALVDEAFHRYPVSGELNYRIDGDAGKLVKQIAEKYERQGGEVTSPDGLSVTFPDWRFSLRVSNTEPLLRLNVESRGDRLLMEQKKDELEEKIRNGPE
ncbi:phosphomannomutase/phosphoglucomutase [Balneolales bacterium ANBcel1]|nr:phosphomannomutase/phosphoglucomutase [Balneolales bacterium ANBcel1]